MNWKKLYPPIEKICRIPGLIFIFIVCASATIGLLYIQDPFEEFFQYLPATAGLLYLLGRFSFGLYSRFTLTVNELLAFLFLISTAAALSGQYALAMDINDQNGVSSWDYTFAMWFFGVSYLLAGASCGGAKYTKSNIIAVILCAVAVIPLITALEGKLLLDYGRMRSSLGMKGFSHLTIAEWYVFLFIGAYAFAGNKLRPLIIIIAMIALFSLQGRSSTFFTVFTFVIYGFLSSGRKFLWSLAAIACVLLLAYTYLPLEDILFNENSHSLDRMLLNEEITDNSLEGRIDIFEISVGHLPSSILFGDPTFIAIEGRAMGSYIHNLLSAWQFFGLLPFLLLCVMLIKALFIMVRLVRTGKPTVMDEVGSLVLIYSVISVAISKSIVFYWVWFAVGYWMLQYSTRIQHTPYGGRSRRKRRKRKRRSY